MEAAAFCGYLRHERFSERRRAFRHPLALFYFNVEEGEELFARRLQAGRVGLSFRSEDYLPGPGPLAARARAELERLTGVTADGPVFLLATVRSWGVSFNPIALFYCFDGAGDLAGVVAEVTNTPWGERRAYALAGERPGSADKELYVSPFLDLGERYRWRAKRPGETVFVEVENFREGRRTFRAVLAARRRPLSRRLLLDPRFRYRSSPQRTLALIYAHALLLRASGVGWRSHTARGAAGVA